MDIILLCVLVKQANVLKTTKKEINERERERERAKENSKHAID